MTRKWPFNICNLAILINKNIFRIRVRSNFRYKSFNICNMSKLKSARGLTVLDRMALIDSIKESLAEGTLEIADAVRRLRVEVTGLHQSQFAKMCKI